MAFNCVCSMTAEHPVSLKMSMYTCPVGSGCEELVVLGGGGGGGEVVVVEVGAGGGGSSDVAVGT